jgi:hypothetical protein
MIITRFSGCELVISTVAPNLLGDGTAQAIIDLEEAPYSH